MNIANLFSRRMICFLILIVASSVPNNALAQADQEKEKAPSQEKKTDEKKPNTAVRGGIEILSDTMGVDFGPYMQRLKGAVQTHWEPLVPVEAVLIMKS